MFKRCVINKLKPKEVKLVTQKRTSLNIKQPYLVGGNYKWPFIYRLSGYLFLCYNIKCDESNLTKQKLKQVLCGIRSVVIKSNEMFLTVLFSLNQLCFFK